MAAAAEQGRRRREGRRRQTDRKRKYPTPTRPDGRHPSCAVTQPTWSTAVHPAPAPPSPPSAGTQTQRQTGPNRRPRAQEWQRPRTPHRRSQRRHSPPAAAATTRAAAGGAEKSRRTAPSRRRVPVDPVDPPPLRKRQASNDRQTGTTNKDEASDPSTGKPHTLSETRGASGRGGGGDGVGANRAAGDHAASAAPPRGHV